MRHIFFCILLLTIDFELLFVMIHVLLIVMREKDLLFRYSNDQEISFYMYMIKCPDSWWWSSISIVVWLSKDKVYVYELVNIMKKKSAQENEKREKEKRIGDCSRLTPPYSPPILSVFYLVHTPISGSCSFVRSFARSLYISYSSVMYKEKYDCIITTASTMLVLDVQFADSTMSGSEKKNNIASLR